MLTVRVILESGLEIVQPVTSVQHRPADESLGGEWSVTYFDMHGNACDVFDGDVYVMNDNGKTVADYHMHYPLGLNERIKVRGFADVAKKNSAELEKMK